jgi:hypothetical protein
MSRISEAIRMLAVAAENDDLDRADYEEAAEGLQQLQSAVVRHDDTLDQDEAVPTGDDYNDLLSIIQS